MQRSAIPRVSREWAWRDGSPSTHPLISALGGRRGDECERDDEVKPIHHLITKQSFMTTPTYVFLMFVSSSISFFFLWDYFNSGISANFYGIVSGIFLCLLISWLVHRKAVFFYHDRVLIRNIFKSHSIQYEDLVVIWRHATELIINDVRTNQRTYVLEFLPKDRESINFGVSFAGQATHLNIQRALDHVRRTNPKVRILFPNDQNACQVCGASLFSRSMVVCNKCNANYDKR